MKVLVGGDFAPWNRTGNIIEQHDFKFLDGIREIAEKADFSIVNLEAPITERDDRTIIKRGPSLHCPAATADALRYAGIDIVTLANNHILDFGATALNRTIKLCNDAGIRTVGAGADLYEAEKVLYIEYEGKTLGIVNCCEHEFSIATEYSAGANPLNPIRQYYKIQEAKSLADYVMVIVHGGHEMFQLPSPRMQEAYRFFIDSGADVVINHHQHCYSGYEIYKSRPIFYGLGNLNFDINNITNSIWNYGYMVMIDFDKEINFSIFPYEQCSHESISTRFLAENAFDKEIADLNDIISDSDKLQKTIEAYYDKESRNVALSFDFYDNKYLRALRRRNWIPSFISKKKKLEIQNLIFCEAHFDKVKHFFKSCK